MDEPGAPSPAATNTRTATFTVNINYLTSPPGILKICEFVLGLLCWALAASVHWAASSSPWQFVLFVSVTAWLMTIITFVIYFTGLHATSCSGAPWSVIEFANNALWTVFYFIAACVAAAYTSRNGNLAASCAFAFFSFFAFAALTALSFKEWRGAFPWGAAAAAGGGASVSA